VWAAHVRYVCDSQVLVCTCSAFDFMFLLLTCARINDDDDKFKNYETKKWKICYMICALFLYRRRRFINHLLTYLFTYITSDKIDYNVFKISLWTDKKDKINKHPTQGGSPPQPGCLGLTTSTGPKFKIPLRRSLEPN